MNWILLAAITTFIAVTESAPSVTEVSRPQTCKDGDTWKEDCNSCWCDNGRPACTLMGCVTRPSRSSDHSEPCIPQSAWKEGSKYCTCSERGFKSCVQDITRSKREAVEDVITHQVELHKNCSEGTVWKTNCADCKCTVEGPHCSKVPDCIPGPIYYPKSTCVGDETWHDECNNLCKCLNEKPVCTKASCGATPHRPKTVLLNKIRDKQQQLAKRDTSFTNGRIERDISVDDVIRHEVEVKKNCAVNTVWTSNCAQCKCTESGPLCSAVEGCTPLPITTPKIICEEGERWMDDCNQCWCNKGGIPACTRKLCESHPHYEISHPRPSEEEGQTASIVKREANEEKHCKPGTVWIQMTDNDEGCAKFKCHADGTVTSKPHFTREMCPSEPQFVDDDESDEQQQHVSKREAGCKPGTVWIKMTDNDEGCAKFKCNADGTVTSKPHFTREMCPSEPEFVEDDDDVEQQQHVSKREAGCKPGTVWIKMTDNDEGCAKFKCHTDGTVTSKPHFTREMCPSEPEFVEDDDDDDEDHQQQQHVSKRDAGCKPGTVWIKMTDNDEGCAKFRCHADGTITSKPHFTREMCPSEPEFIEDDDDEQQQQQQHVSKREAGCKPGDKWMEDCNECTCNEEGKGSCTRMLCENDADEIPWLSEPEGQQQQQKTKREASCKPGTVWIKMTDNDEGCAKFKCHADGTVTSKPHFTREMCPSEPEFVEDDDDNEEQQQQHQVSKREAGCKPGDKWMEDCNECTCNEHGKGSCTRMLCDKDADEIPWLSEQEGQQQQQQQHTKRDTRLIRNRRSQPPPVGCKAGESYFDGCNVCVCSNSGPPSCTYKICPPDTQVQTVSFGQLPETSQQNVQQAS